MKRKTAPTGNFHDAIVRDLRILVETPDLHPRFAAQFRAELAAAEAGPVRVHWWELPEEYGIHGPHHGGAEFVEVHADGTITPVPESAWRRPSVHVAADEN